MSGGSRRRRRRLAATDCGACEPVCPVNAISTDLRITEEKVVWRDDNAAFFDETLPGRDGPLGSPGGAGTSGPVGIDSPFASRLPVVER